MSRAQKYIRWFALVVMLVAGAQVAASFIVKTRSVRAYLIAHLQRAFGRPVQAGSFSVQILPIPKLSIDNVTIGENPAFGYEYFLRAENMGASLRWRGLLTGHFEFGTMSLTRPSLILVRNAQGRWNLEDWLPPANAGRSTSSSDIAGNAQPRIASTHHLQKIEFDDGRINFKMGDEKRPFAFTNVSGSVEQIEGGRWHLELEAVPWRSGAGLQSSGVVQVRGDVAGTSARLQPAQLQVHWEKASLADLFRLATGNDSGVRGELALDGTASVGQLPWGETSPPGQWRFEARARTRQVHRWDLTERTDNPKVNLSVRGVWDLPSGEVRAESLQLTSADSQAQGTAVLQTNAPPAFRIHVNSAAVQADDLLAWCRAFQPNVAEEIVADEFFTGSGELHGWPLQWDAAEISSTSGTVVVPGVAQAVQIDPFQGALRGRRFMLEPVRVVLGTSLATGKSKTKVVARVRGRATSENTIESVLLEDFASGEGLLRVYMRMADVRPAFQVAAAFGHPVNHGWELSGAAGGRFELGWQRGFKNRHWNSSFDLSKGELQAAGLNLPLKLDEVHVDTKESGKNIQIARVGAFGGVWTGSIEERKRPTEASDWRFQLHTDLLDAAEMDRWVGPRSRPSWLQRLMSSLLVKSDSGAKPSELLRRVSADGDVSIDNFVVDKVRLAHATGKVALHDLHLEVRDAEAQWAGGTVSGGMKALFSVSPKYEIVADFSRVNLAQLPWTPRWAERWSGAASGKMRLTTTGVGRAELLKKLAGTGNLRLNGVEFRGWDVPSSVESGTLRTGVSRWSNGEGEFALEGPNLMLESVQLEAPHGKNELNGKIGFGQDGKLTFTPAAPENRDLPIPPGGRTLQVSGPLDTPAVVVEPVSASGAGPGR
jgi:AsmA family